MNGLAVPSATVCLPRRRCSSPCPAARNPARRHTARDQVDTRVLNRADYRMVTARNRLISPMWASCMEYGAPLRLGVGDFQNNRPRLLAVEANELMRGLHGDLLDELKALEQRRAKMTKQIDAPPPEMTVPVWACPGTTPRRARLRVVRPLSNPILRGHETRHS
jgi:hypothetical protein